MTKKGSLLIRASAILFAVLLVCPRSSGQPHKLNLAVLQIEGVDCTAGELQGFSDRLRYELFNTGAFVVLEREQMNQVLKEQGLQQTGCTSSECAVQIGQLLNVQGIVLGNVAKVGTLYSIQLRIVDVATGATLATSKYDCQNCSIEALMTAGFKESASQLATQSHVQTSGDGRDRCIAVACAFMKAIDARDYDKAYSFLSAKDTAVMTRGKFTEKIEGQRQTCYFFEPKDTTRWYDAERLDTASLERFLIPSFRKYTTAPSTNVWCVSERVSGVDVYELWNEKLRGNDPEKKMKQLIAAGAYPVKNQVIRRIWLVKEENDLRVALFARSDISLDSATAVHKAFAMKNVAVDPCSLRVGSLPNAGECIGGTYSVSSVQCKIHNNTTDSLSLRFSVRIPATADSCTEGSTGYLFPARTTKTEVVYSYIEIPCDYFETFNNGIGGNPFDRLLHAPVVIPVSISIDWRKSTLFWGGYPFAWRLRQAVPEYDGGFLLQD